MRYPASEKLEIIRLVERSHRPAKWRLISLAFHVAHSTVGMIGTCIMVRTGLLTAPRIQAACGTRYLTMSARMSWIWRLIYQSYRRVS